MAITESTDSPELSGAARQGTTVNVRSPFKKDQVRKILSSAPKKPKPKPKVNVGTHKRKGFVVKAHQRGFPRKLSSGMRTAGSNPSKGRSAVPESESTVAAYHTSSVNAPLGYQGLFREN